MASLKQQLQELLDDLQKNACQWIDHGVGFESTPWVAITDDEGIPYLKEKIKNFVKDWLEAKRCSEEHLVVEGTHGLLSAHRNAIIDELLAMLEEA